METNPTATDLTNLINEAADAMVDLDQKINELEALKSSLATDILRAQAALDQLQVQEYAAEIREEEPEPERNTDDADTDSVVRFKPGITYVYSLVTDSSARIPATVVSRTDKTVVIEEYGKRTRRKVRTNFNRAVEYIMPDGQYSMAPILSADCPR